MDTFPSKLTMPSSSLLLILGAGLLFFSLSARAQDGIVVDDTAAGNDVGSAGQVGGRGEAESHDIEDSGALGNDLPFARAAVFGHATMAAGRRPASANSDHEGTVAAAAAAMLPPFEDFSNPPRVQNSAVFGHAPIPSSNRAAAPVGPTAADINLALAGLNQATMILEHLAANGCGGGGGNNCDLSAFPDCTCANPAEFTQDGRGNCNLGVTKPDLQVWCYVDPNFGHPTHVCPDARESSSRPGSYWSRFACITE